VPTTIHEIIPPAFFSHKGRPHMWVLHMKTTFMLEEDVVTSPIRNTAHHTTHETNQLSQLASCYTLSIDRKYIKNNVREREREEEEEEEEELPSFRQIIASNCKFMTKAKQNNTIYLHKRSTNQNYRVSDM